MVMKIVVYVLTILVVISVVEGWLKTEAASYEDCRGISDKDTLLYRHYIREGPRLCLSRKVAVAYPEIGSRSEIIHCIKVLDQSGSGRRVTIDAGGVNSSYVLLTVASKHCRGLDMIVEVYGY